MSTLPQTIYTTIDRDASFRSSTAPDRHQQHRQLPSSALSSSSVSMANRISSPLRPAPTSMTRSGRKLKSPYDRPRRPPSRLNVASSSKPLTRGRPSAAENIVPDQEIREIDVRNFRSLSLSVQKQQQAAVQYRHQPPQSLPSQVPSPARSAVSEKRRPRPLNVQPVVLPALNYPPLAQADLIDQGQYLGKPDVPAPSMAVLQIPCKLPRPPVPKVDVQNVFKSELTASGDINEIRSRLKKVSKDLLQIASLYRPARPTPAETSSSVTTATTSTAEYLHSSPRLSPIREEVSIDTSSPPSSSRTSDSTTRSQQQSDLKEVGPFPVQFNHNLPFGLPKTFEGGQGWRGLEPDCCIAVRSTRWYKKGLGGLSDAEREEEVGRIMPIHHSVYAAYCANFPPPSGAVLDESGTPIPSTSKLDQRVEKEQRQVSDETDENMETQESQSTVETDDEERRLRSFLRLPMLHVSVPFPSLLAPLHHYLYLADPARLLSFLLDLPAQITSPVAMTPAQRMASLPLPALTSRLRKIHKVWSNVVSLGIDDEMLWRVMEKAWSLAMDGLQSQSHHHETSQQARATVGQPSLRQMADSTRSDSHAQYVSSSLRIPALPGHPRSAGLQSTGHVMGL